MGAIVIICHCGSDNVNHVRALETDVGIYEHVFLCKTCETTMVFRVSQILTCQMEKENLT